MSVHDDENSRFDDHSEVSLRVSATRQKAEEWALVLTAEGLSPTLHSTLNGFVVAVPGQQATAAIRILAAYDAENAPSSEASPPPRPPRWLAGVLTAEFLLGFYAVTTMRNSTVPWFERGSGDAGRIVAGELWRAVTALTLHSDIGHVLSNAVAAAVFFSAVFGLLGIGMGSLLLLLSGAGGNLVNAFLRGSPHVSVGASTAVFAAVGILGGMAVIRPVAPQIRGWLGAGAALALLAMLGSGGPPVDVLAHLFGFLFGGAAALVHARLTARPAGPAIQFSAGFTAATLVVYCWVLALR
ncbi:MAG TPA: rhomboid family intramembrane serine protease [Candidatus Binatia bacterium]